MSNSILISEKYGVNPTLPVCFWCGEENGTVALLGRLKGDVEAPRHPCLNYDPCPACEEQWKQGITLIEASETPTRDGQPSMQATPKAYPTGRLFVITEEAVERIFQPEEYVKGVLRARMAFVDQDVFQMLAASAPAEDDPS